MTITTYSFTISVVPNQTNKHIEYQMYNLLQFDSLRTLLGQLRLDTVIMV